MLALARHVESRLLQGGDHAGPVLHRAARDATQQVVPDLVPGIGLMRDPRPQLRRRDVGAVPRLLLPRPRRVIRTAPAVLDVARLDQRAIGLLPARRRDVEALARLQVAPRGEHMHVHAAVGIAVPHRRPRIAIRGQPGPGGLLDLVEHPVDVLVARLVLRRPGDHARRVFVVELQRVGHRRHVVRISAQDRHVGPDLALAVQLARQVAAQVVTVGGRQTACAPPRIAIRLAHPVTTRLGRWLELLAERFRRPTRANEVDQPSTELS